MGFRGKGMLLAGVTSDRLTATSARHKYEKLQLKPEDEFLAEHPELVGADEHAIMTARIQSEHAERKALDLQRQEAANRRATLIAENKLKKDNLALLDREAEKFIDVGFLDRPPLP